MSNYTKTVDFAVKDGLLTGNPAKAGKGADVDTEFNNISAAIATKEDAINKNAASGYAGLDSNTLLSSSQMPRDALPQSSQSANYTLVIGDANKHILHPSGAGSDTFTIPANASVAFPTGTIVTFVNLDSSNVTIAITSDTMTLAGTTTTGSRTLLQNGIATALKVGSTSWLISGTGLA